MRKSTIINKQTGLEAICFMVIIYRTLKMLHRLYFGRLQTECGNYRMIAEEAYKQFLQIQGRDLLSRSMDGQLKDWLDLMEEVCV